jgi:uncharacterized protein YaeQ
MKQDNSPTALFVKNWIKANHPNLSDEELELRWLAYLKRSEETLDIDLDDECTICGI